MTSVHVTLRDATLADCNAINAIYNHYVATSTCTYDLEPMPEEARRAWFAHHGARHPVIVAEKVGAVIGWGSLSPFRDRPGYRFTVENSVYVHHDYHRCGIGSVLLAELIRRARAAEYRVIIAGVDGEQHGSARLHEKFGFEKVAHFRKIGTKFERWLDVLFFQLDL